MYRLENGTLQLFCVDGVDSESLYCRSVSPHARVERHRQYERYILEEVIPLMRADNGAPWLVAHLLLVIPHKSARLHESDLLDA